MPPVRAIRIDDDIWHPAVARAAKENTTIAKVVSRFLAGYGAGDPSPPSLRTVTSTDCTHPRQRRDGKNKNLCRACGTVLT